MVLENYLEKISKISEKLSFFNICPLDKAKKQNINGRQQCTTILHLKPPLHLSVMSLIHIIQSPSITYFMETSFL